MLILRCMLRAQQVVDMALCLDKIGLEFAAQDGCLVINECRRIIRRILVFAEFGQPRIVACTLVACDLPVLEPMRRNTVRTGAACNLISCYFAADQVFASVFRHPWHRANRQADVYARAVSINQVVAHLNTTVVRIDSLIIHVVGLQRIDQVDTAQ